MFKFNLILVKFYYLNLFSIIKAVINTFALIAILAKAINNDNELGIVTIKYVIIISISNNRLYTLFTLHALVSKHLI